MEGMSGCQRLWKIDCSDAGLWRSTFAAYAIGEGAIVDLLLYRLESQLRIYIREREREKLWRREADKRPRNYYT
jgi:hypothetical protein